MIFKLQRPLSKSGPETADDRPKVLVYNEDRSVLCFMPWDNLDELLPDGAMKVYVEAELKDGELRMSHRVDDQDW